ncbi:MAG TPA: response regulator transcription factor [Caulobacteraceae bacterium]|nr:response regulator transcription factor [Caulobacteraceae bacterium]
MIRIVVVEDEPLTRRVLELGLSREGFEVVSAPDAASCRAILASRRIDAVVLDLGLPDADGMVLASEIRAKGGLGLLVVTRRREPESRIEALDLGADDYLVKPVHLGELSARIRSVLRRRRPAGPNRRRLGGWLIDLDARTAVASSGAAELTRGEFDLLALLIEADGRVVGREELLKAISRNPEEGDPRSVDVLVSRLRRKLAECSREAEIILTAPGLGYRLAATATEA